MEKNTIIAIVLSAIVLFVSLFVQQTFFTPKQTVQPVKTEQVNIQQTESEEETDVEEKEAAEEEVLQEETAVIRTDKVKVTFTSKGGDVISYKILDHLDKDIKIKERDEFNQLVKQLFSFAGKDSEKVLLTEDNSRDK